MWNAKDEELVLLGVTGSTMTGGDDGLDDEGQPEDSRRRCDDCCSLQWHGQSRHSQWSDISTVLGGLQ
ncbi:hypothetical protein TYRP_010512 [Tyrophagus putrescentiae]|nr:hypothetical protein TYRP_010512 [Tyrophagus putrescentiae]